MIQDLKNQIVEHTPVYMSKALAAVSLLGLTTTDFIDWILRIIAGFLAAVVTIWTIKRMSADIAYRKAETKEKLLDASLKEEELKQHILENKIRAEELQRLLKSNQESDDKEK